MDRLYAAAFAALTFTLSTTATAGETPAPADAKVYFIDLNDGDKVSSPIDIRFGIEGMQIVPAGTEQEYSGHHHLLIDTTLDGASLDVPIPADEQHIHFGSGQKEARVELSPGEHTLQLVLGDLNHIPHNPPVISERITITVE
ncbi:DUF4399 domain-containing protein [Rhizobiales bacterium]|uniref:DUF4399 domain-containing protein n=1 Tax=Hongsoonwoonella zoysiae TaxID=2821844 RepID=UPI00156191DC|nr:DUF4399 domain-containing protein [Hongsoonwoonella zoysiae]NRG17103.1 DUF4399 domain-containing protein [Hongsoonwoonella zoysiae]